MAFQTNVLRDGEWVTETVDLHALLKANSTTKGNKRSRQLKSPHCGILTNTVVESQLVNSILPVRLRSHRLNDIAFVGDNSIKIYELQDDSRLVEVAVKNDFGSRIRNACVIGSFDIKTSNGEQESALSHLHFSPPSLFDVPSLPPQMLLLVLEWGAMVFLFLRPTQAGRYEFETVYAGNPKPECIYLGFHTAVDPSSRYMVLANHQEYVFVYELESHDKLNREYSSGRPLVPIRYHRPRHIQGVIHSATFLYPRPGDDHHIILLLVIVKNEKQRMVIYEWKLGDNLAAVFAEEKRGHRMPSDHRLPLFIVPLFLQSAFMIVYQENVIVCTEALHGPPKFASMAIQTKGPTKFHYGNDPPLWAAWTRPLRLSSYFDREDCIYLAREDGVMTYVTASQDGSDLGVCSHDIDKGFEFDCNISGAFTSVYHQCSDALVIGGVSPAGGVWSTPARKKPIKLSTLPAVSSTMDFATTDEFTSWDQGASSPGSKGRPQEVDFRKADRLFTASGRGHSGAITEYRHGLKADIELEFEYGPGVKNVWLFPSRYDGTLKGFDILLSLPESSAALHFNDSFDEVSDLDPSAVPYELSSPTLAFEYTDSLLVQITQLSVTLLAPNKGARYSFGSILGQYSNTTISDACILDGHFACSLYADSRYLVLMFRIDTTGHSVVNEQTFEVGGDITCLAMNSHYLVAGVWKDRRPFLAVYPRTNPSQGIQLLDLLPLLTSSSDAGTQSDFNVDAIEPIASVVCFNDTVLIGLRSGEVITLVHTGTGQAIYLQKFGMTTAYITCNRTSRGLDIDTEPSVFVCCDGNLVLLQPNSSPQSSQPLSQSRPSWTRFRDFQVFPVDEQNSKAPAPSIDFGVAVDVPSDGPGSRQFLMVSGTNLLLARLNQKPGPVHRQIPIPGVPTRLIYSPKLRCLIAAVNRNDKTTLMFMDPDTGEDIGQPTDKSGNAVDYISSLGKTGDTIFGLEEWKFRKDGSVWEYILVSTKLGRLIVVDTKTGESAEGRRWVKYWTRFTHKEQSDCPIYSVLGCDGGLVYCAGNKIHWQVLDTEAKKFKHLKTHELSCPGTSLKIANGKLMVLTSRDSLLVHSHSMDDGNAVSLCHADPKARNATHMMEIAGPQLDEPMGSITLVADRDCGVGGLWIPWQSPQKNCEVVFEVELEASVRRFRRGRTRPIWERPLHVAKYGRLLTTVDDAEILGVSLDGSLRHFTLLGLDIWRLLRFIQNLAMTDADLCPITLHQPTPDMAKFDPEPKATEKGLSMHVDGDILRRCLDKRALIRLLSEPRHAAQFMELLDELGDGVYVPTLTDAGWDDKVSGYASLAYDILEYYLVTPL